MGAGFKESVLEYGGLRDIVTSTRDIKSVVERAQNANLKCEIVSNSGHMPGKAGMEAVYDTLIKLIDDIQEDEYAEG